MEFIFGCFIILLLVISLDVKLTNMIMFYRRKQTCEKGWHELVFEKTQTLVTGPRLPGDQEIYIMACCKNCGLEVAVTRRTPPPDCTLFRLEPK